MSHLDEIRKFIGIDLDEDDITTYAEYLNKHKTFTGYLPDQSPLSEVLSAEFATPRSNIIEMLTEMLERAKTGELQHCIICGIICGGKANYETFFRESGYINIDSAYAMLGALEHAKLALVRDLPISNIEDKQ